VRLDSRAIAEHGGLITTAELHSLSMTRASIRAAVVTGTLLHVRKGWYASPGIAEPLLAAA